MHSEQPIHPDFSDNSETHRFAADILAKLRESIAKLPPCEKDCVRLWRGAVIDSAKYSRMYSDTRSAIFAGNFVADTPEKFDVLNRIISDKDRLIGRFYSDSLAATLPYFLRHNQDVDAKRVLYYLDVPMHTARRNYFANVASNAIGAVQHKHIFDGIIFAATERSKIAQEALKHAPMNGLPYDDEMVDSTNPQNTIMRLAHEIQVQDYRAGAARSSRGHHQELIDAFQTCKFEDIDDEFYLPESRVEQRIQVAEIDGPSSIRLSERQWQEIGSALDSAFNPGLSTQRESLKFRSHEEALREWFNISPDAAALEL